MGQLCLRRHDDIIKNYDLDDILCLQVQMDFNFSNKYQHNSPVCDVTKYLSLLEINIDVCGINLSRYYFCCQWIGDKDQRGKMQKFHGVTKGSELTRLFGFVNAAHSTNKDSTSQTGEFFDLGVGPLMNLFFGKSFKQKGLGCRYVRQSIKGI